MNRETVADLAQRIHEIEASERPLVQTTIPFPPLADALPGGGLPSGSLVEIMSALDGDGAWTFALLLARCACAERKTFVVADTQRTFYPPAAARLGIDLQRTLILRPAFTLAGSASDGLGRPSLARPANVKKGKNGVAAFVQSLRCPAVGAVLGRFERLTAAEYRTLQLAAQTGGGVGFLLRPISARGDPSFADVRLRMLPSPSVLRGRGAGGEGAALATTSLFPVCSEETTSLDASSPSPPVPLPLSTGGEGRNTRRIQVEVLRARGGKAGRTLVLEIDHETGDVRLLPRLADAAPPACSARAS